MEHSGSIFATEDKAPKCWVTQFPKLDSYSKKAKVELSGSMVLRHLRLLYLNEKNIRDLNEHFEK